MASLNLGHARSAAAVQNAIPSLVLPLNGIVPDQRPSVGGKVANLAALTRAGLPVPRGFCITTAAFDQFVSACPGRARLSALLSQCSADQFHRIADLSREARSCLVATDVPPAVRESVLTAWREMGEGRAYAVRSSATVEDGRERSFAGQFESSLNVRGGEALLAAIKACWVSLFSERALVYLAHQEIPLTAVKMAVLVQEMVAADFSGVMFTADPLIRAADRLVLEWVPGLGDVLVQGTRAPRRMVIEKTTGRALESENAPDPMPESVRRRLLDLGEAIERLLGSSQDIEWAGRDGEVWLLQARPITALRGSAEESPRITKIPGRTDSSSAARDAGAGRGSRELASPVSRQERASSPRPSPPLRGGEGEMGWGVPATRASPDTELEIWSNLNTVENLPDVATPLTWSLLDFSVQRFFRPVFDLAGANLDRERWLGLVAGRVYMNVGFCLRVLRCLPGFRLDRLAWLFGGHQDAVAAVERLRQPNADASALRVKIGAVVRVARVAAGFLRMGHWESNRKCLARITAFVDQLDQLNCRQLSADDLFARLNGLEDDIKAHLRLPVMFGAGIVFHGLFRRGCRKWLRDPHGVLANRLLSHAGGMASAEPAKALWQLATVASRQTDLRAAVLSARNFAELSGPLVATGTGQEFLEQWDAFMRRHGHHAAGEVDIAVPRWSERPDDVLRLVQGYLDGVEQHDPLRVLEERMRERERLLEECEARLRNPLRRWWFGFLLRRTQEWIVLRENIKNELVRGLAALRRIYQELDDRMVRQEILERAGDIFFLAIDEIEPVYRGAAKFDVRAVIRVRREEFARNRGVTPPPVVVGTFDPARHRHIPSATVQAARELKGLPVSAGVVTGPARVMLRFDATARVLPGEILVAPFTDPGWTPYFLMAGGLVTDIGGQLSHGSVVAREFGLPAVVNVPFATQIIRTGQVIRVDGDHGTVSVLME